MFLSPDPMGLSAATLANPGSWNRYAYASSDPINFVDPAGRSDCGADWMTNASESGPCSNPCDGSLMENGLVSVPNAVCLIAVIPPILMSRPAQVFGGLTLVGYCYDRSAGAFGQTGGAADLRLTYMPVDTTGAPYLGTVTIQEQNTVTQGQATSINTSWTVSGGATFDDYISSGAGQSVFAEQQQFFLAGSTNALQINWFFGDQYKQLGVYATPSAVKVNNTYPVNKDGSPHYCDQPASKQVR
jgi:hypothetical protein